MSSSSQRQRLETMPSKRAGETTATSLQWRTTVVFLTVAALLVVLYGLWLIRAVALLIFAGVLAGLALSSICAWVETHIRLKRRWSLPLVLLIVVAVLWGGIWLRGPAIETQIDQLQERLPQAAKAFAAQLREQQWGRWLITHGFGPQQFPRAIEVLPKVTGFLSSTLGLLGGVAIVFFLGIVIAAEPQSYRGGFERFFPASTRGYVIHVVDEIADALRWWLFARILSMTAVGVMVFLGLWMLGIPMPGTLGALAALLAFIPNIGPVVSAIPPILLALSSGPRQAVFVVLLFWAVHAMEGFLITPIAERTAVHLPPALTLSVQLSLAVLVGVMGIALAAPLTTVAMVLFRTVYCDKVLNERSTTP